MAGLIVKEPDKHAHQHGENSQIGNEIQGLAHEAVGQIGAGQVLRTGFQGSAGHLQIALLIAAHGLVAGGDGADAVDHQLHAQGRNEGGDLQVGNHAAVDGPENSHNRHDDQHGDRPGDVGQVGEHFGRVVHLLQQHGGHTGGQAHLAARRQIGALGNQAAGHAAGDDKPGRHVDNQVLGVALAEEILGVKVGNHRQQQNQQDNRVVRHKLFGVE